MAAIVLLRYKEHFDMVSDNFRKLASIKIDDAWIEEYLERMVGNPQNVADGRGRTILVDTSAGASAAGDSWSTASLADVNARITEGVIAANITGTAPSGLQNNISKLAGLTAIPGCQ